MKKTTLIKQIKTAFADVPYPNDGNITKTNCYGMDCRCAECYEIQEKFAGKAWQELTADFVAYHYDSLPLFTSDALRYYLPAYLLLSVKDPIEYCNVSDCLVFCLRPPKQLLPEEDDDWFQKFGETEYEYFVRRMSGYTIPQREAIANFLRFQNSYESAQNYSLAVQWWNNSGK